MKTFFLLSFILSNISFGSLQSNLKSNLKSNYQEMKVLNQKIKSDWFLQEFEISKIKLLQNLSPNDGLPGSVIASPSRTSPDYYYHWVRDAALAMDAVVSLLKQSNKMRETEKYEMAINNYIEFSKFIQNQPTLTGLGEPKFYVNGKGFEGPWGRPQNDGPALRAVTLLNYIEWLKDKGDFAKINDLYDGKQPSQSSLKRDLEYVSNHWQESSFDLWEEVLGDHFYTRIVQHKALVLGAKLAADLLDYGASDWYLKQANLIQHSILGFWDSRVNYLGATQNWKGGVDYKHSNLDIAVILGVLHGHSEELNIKFTDERIVRTKNQLVKTFSSLYEINRNAQAPGVAIGRYSEDRYDGYHFRYGNPWVLSTLAIAEYYYKSAVEVAKSKKNGIKEIQKYINTGDSFVKRVQFHANPDGSLSEQMDRYSGYMTSAPELTWNYAAIITAYLARQNAQNVLSNLKNH